ncbi:hypothetical protein ACIP93_17360 [Streptomyces sp. NPDC088745]|uniref:hypothetical protein n=1 Tax=Streptomyces sp. NPDC088745 TaxID=3365884 RepID=UPI00382811A5
MTALRALRKSRTDLEALDLTADRLRRIREAATKTVNASRARANRHTAQTDAAAVRPDDQQAHHPQQPGPHRGRKAGPLSRPDGAHPVGWIPPLESGRHRERHPLHRVEPTEWKWTTSTGVGPHIHPVHLSLT